MYNLKQCCSNESNSFLFFFKSSSDGTRVLKDSRRRKTLKQRKKGIGLKKNMVSTISLPSPSPSVSCVNFQIAFPWYQLCLLSLMLLSLSALNDPKFISKFTP